MSFPILLPIFSERVNHPEEFQLVMSLFPHSSATTSLTRSSVAGAQVVRSAGGDGAPVVTHEGEFLFLFVLNGGLSFSKDGNTQDLESGDSIVIPRDIQYALTNCSDDVTFLEVTLPGTFTTIDQEVTPEQLVTGSWSKR